MTTNDNPLIKYSTVEVGGTTLKLSYSFASIAKAERLIPGLNLLTVFQRLTSLNANEALCLVYAAALTYQPKISLDQVSDFFTIESQPRILNALAEAYVLSLPPKKEDDEAIVEESPNEPRKSLDE